MAFKDVMFGAFTPDLGGVPDALDPGYLVDCVNLRPTPQGYREFNEYEDVTSAGALAGGTVNNFGTMYGTVRGGTSYFFAAANMSSASYCVNQSNDLGVSWDNVLTLPHQHPDFAQFDDYVICTAQGATVKYKDITASQATAFVDLPDSPPQGTTIARVRDHIVIGNTSSAPFTIQWSAIGNPTDWPTPLSSEAQAKESGSQVMPSELGTVTKIVGGEKFGLVFQQRGITRMTYVGGNVMYEFDTFEKRYGTYRVSDDGQSVPVIPKIGDAFYYANNLGIFATDGYTVRNMADGQVRQSLFLGDPLHPENSSPYRVISSSFNAAHGSLLYQIVGLDTHLAYSVDYGRFFMFNHPIGALIDLDAVLASGSFVTGFNYQLASSGVLQRSSSATPQPEIALQTGFIELEPGHYCQLEGVQILGNGGQITNTTVSVKGVVERDDTDMDQSGFSAMTAPTGRVYKSTRRENSALYSFRLTNPGFTGLLRGLRIYYKKGEPVT